MHYQKVNKLEELLPVELSSSPSNNTIINDIRSIESKIISYIVYLKNVDKLAYGTIHGYLTAIEHFYAICSDLNLNHKRINRYLPEPQKIADDRGYSTEEIAKLLEGSDSRLRALILLLASTGLRIGSIADLKLKHIHKIPEHNLYKVVIYSGFKEEYFSFTTPEAAKAIDTYLQYRERYGEKLTPESYLFREQFNVLDVIDCKNPKKMHLKGLSRLIGEASVRSGVMQKGSLNLLEGEKYGKKRNNIFRTHGFRKTVTTKMVEAGLNDFAIEKLLGHKSKGANGITSKHYYRPEENDLLQEYLKAVDYLTINEENRLRRENQTLKVKKSEIEQLKEEVAEYRSFQSQFNPQIEMLQREISSLKIHLNSKNKKK